MSLAVASVASVASFASRSAFYAATTLLHEQRARCGDRKRSCSKGRSWISTGLQRSKPHRYQSSTGLRWPTASCSRLLSDTTLRSGRRMRISTGCPKPGIKLGGKSVKSADRARRGLALVPNLLEQIHRDMVGIARESIRAGLGGPHTPGPYPSPVPGSPWLQLRGRSRPRETPRRAKSAINASSISSRVRPLLRAIFMCIANSWGCPRRDHHGHRHQTACFPIQAGTCPDFTEGLVNCVSGNR